MSEQFTINDKILVNLKSNEVTHQISGLVFQLGTNEIELLRYFSVHPGETISRQVLTEEIWVSKGVVVEDGSLIQAISKSRKALQDKDSKIIVTERGKGYRFNGDINVQ